MIKKTKTKYRLILKDAETNEAVSVDISKQELAKECYDIASVLFEKLEAKNKKKDA